MDGIDNGNSDNDSRGNETGVSDAFNRYNAKEIIDGIMAVTVRGQTPLTWARQ